MSIVDIINEKTGKFANNIAEAVADLLGHDLKATSIVENIGEGNNIQEALDNISGKSSNNIAEAIDNYYDQEHLGTTISDALERAGDEPGPEPEPPGPEPEPEDDFDHMTKAELQQYANENFINGVDQASQTKAEMIEVIREVLSGRLLDDRVATTTDEFVSMHTFDDIGGEPNSIYCIIDANGTSWGVEAIKDEEAEEGEYFYRVDLGMIDPSYSPMQILFVAVEGVEGAEIHLSSPEEVIGFRIILDTAGE